MNREIENFLEAIKLKRPVLAEVIREFGDMTLGEYADCVSRKGRQLDTIQGPEDFIELSCRFAGNTLGEDAAKLLNERLKTSSNILTSNHLGPMYCNIPLQGTILYSLSELKNSIIPSYAFGDIPLNNTTFPRGIIISEKSKLPIFPDSKKNSLAGLVNSYNINDIRKAHDKLNKKLLQGDVTEAEFSAVENLLNIYADEQILSCPSYSEQSVLINREIWNKLFCFDGKNDYQIPEMYVDEIEKIVIELLKLDLKNNDSLVYHFFFNNSLRPYLLQNLDGKYGCWKTENLEKIIDLNDRGSEISCDLKNKLLAGSGTHFFWGIDHKQRRVPMLLKERNKKLFLVGYSESGNQIEVAFEPDNILNALKIKQILPSLFTCFSTVAFARGFTCYGGFMQVDYLTAMRDCVIHTLQENGFTQWADKVKNVKTDGFCTGPHFIMKKDKNGILHPAATIDIMRIDGLNKCMIEKIKKIPLKYAFYLSLPIMYPAVYRNNERDSELMKISINDIAASIGENNFILI